MLKWFQSPMIVLPFWAVVAALLLVTSQRVELLAVGVVVWPFVEYAAHRWGLHVIAPRAHAAHHRRPGRLAHFTIPIVIAAPVAFVIGAALYVAGAPLSPLGGLLASYVVYDLAHLAAHGLVPFPFRRALVRHHARHHANQACNFGVSAPWIDRLFGTRAP